MINRGAPNDLLGEKSRVQVRSREEASIYARFYKSVGVRCMDISDVAQAGALLKVHLMSSQMINLGASKDPLSEKSRAQVRFIEKVSMYTAFS